MELENEVVSTDSTDIKPETKIEIKEEPWWVEETAEVKLEPQEHVVSEFEMQNKIKCDGYNESEIKLERKRAVKTTQEQYNIYVDFLNQHDIIRSGRLSPSVDPKEVEQKWEELAQLLNSCANGPQKDVKSWKSVFTEWKSVIKRKARILLGDEKKSNTVKPLTDLECRLLAAIGEVMVFDIDTISETTVLPMTNLNMCDTNEVLPSSNSQGLSTEAADINSSDATPLISAASETNGTSVTQCGPYSKRSITTEVHETSVTEGPCTEISNLKEVCNSEASENCSLVSQSVRECYKCEICGKTFTQMSDLKNHDSIHERNLPFKCKLCNKAFTMQSHLKKHINFTHESKRKHNCDICKKKFTQSTDLKQHYLTHKDAQAYKCKICKKVFKIVSETNNDKRPSMCNVCEDSLTELKDVEKPFKCSICDRRYSAAVHLKRHILYHEGKRPHKCKLCDKTFALPSDLKVHLAIHESNKLHKCEMCTKSFLRAANLKRHHLIHEKKTSKHKCEVCEKTFAYKHSLKTHALIHKAERPYECDICKKTFNQMGHLRRHIMMHEGIRSYKCDICEKTYIEKSDLRIHYKSHETRKSYNCEHCGKAFPSKSALKSFWDLKGNRTYRCEICERDLLKLNLKRRYSSHAGTEKAA